MSQELRCISLWQPWASFIAAKIKWVETRSYPAPSTVIGCRIAIHAAQSFSGDKIAMQDKAIWALVMKKLPPILPRGAIVATAVVEASIPTEKLDPDIFGNYGPGRFGWMLSEIEPLETPISCKGRQGIFKVTIP